MRLVKELAIGRLIDRRRALRTRLSKPYPRFLYRYLQVRPSEPESIDRLRDVIVRSELWLSSPAQFNDPFDMSGKLLVSRDGRGNRESLDKIFKEMPNPPSWADRKRRIDEIMSDPDTFEARIQDSFTKNTLDFGVCCFTTKPRNLLMWSHYAASHTGIALQFEPAQDVENLTCPVPVDYNSNYPKFEWLNRREEDIRATMLRKHPDWAYESEWRILHPGYSNSYLQFMPTGLVGVITGCQMSAESKQVIRDLLNERYAAGHPPMNRYCAEKHLSEYRLMIRKD